MLRICSFLVLMLALAAPVPAVSEIAGRAAVVDGDTLDVSGNRIRLHGIDAPERSASCRNASRGDWECGLWAQYEAERRYQGAEVSCRDLGERTHGRVVAQCFHDGRDISHDLIRAGVVQVCPRFALEHAHSRPYIDAEKEAAIAARGIFDGEPPERAAFCREQAAPRELLPVSDQRDDEGTCIIKGNVSGNGRIYHMPGQADYERVKMNHPEKRWFCSEEEAQKAGWRRALR